MALQYVVRPLLRKIEPTGKDPNFSASWSDTLRRLEREVDYLRADRVIFELAVGERDLRIDGMLRASARPEHQGVAIVLLGTKQGDLRFQARLVPGDYSWHAGSQTPWRDNVRAIALTLEALRRVDRYGTTPTAEQYSGFRQLPAPTDPVELGPDAGGTHEDFIAIQAWREAQ